MTQQEYTAIVNEAKQRSYEYYVAAAPTISDAEFDALVDRIAQTEQEHPEWTLADSPTQCVGSDVEATTGKRLVRHRTRMLSCQKAQTTEAVTKWIASTEKKLKKHLTYALEWKMDGVSCSLVYQDGVLVSAASRGNKGVMGQDWLAHVQRIPSVPQSIVATGRVEVRGEVVCPKAELARLGYKDCRTAAASLMNQVWPSDDCKRLVFVAWQMDCDGGIGTESVSMVKASELGFIGEVRTCDGKDVVTLLDEYDSLRESLPYPTDGVVVKIDDKAAAASLGETEHHPKGNIAYKFCAQKAVTRVINIEVKVGETGRRTPVAYLEPVTILGREVSSASLGSERVMAELGVCVGCMVEVGLSNDVTPKVYRVVEGGSKVVAGAPQNPAKSESKSESSEIVAQREQSDARIDYAESQHNSTESQIVPQEETTTDSTDETDSYSAPAESETTNFTNFANNREQSSLLKLTSESKINEVNDTNKETEQNDAPISSIAATVPDGFPSGNSQDLFAQMQMQIDQLRQENDRLCNMIQTERTAVCSPRHEEDCSCVRQEQPHRAARRNRQPLDVSTLYGARPSRTAQAAASYPRFYNSSEISEAEANSCVPSVASDHRSSASFFTLHSSFFKSVGLAAATVVALVVIFKTGLLIPLGLIGLGASGFLK